VLTATCHCGAVRVDIDAELVEVTDCNCSICRRYGVLWAYFSPARVQLVPADAATHTYQWDDRSITFHRCATCGCVTHWAAVDPALDRMGINARLLPLGSLDGIRVRRLDGANTERYVD
jgi:hypothetical protein